MVRAYTSQQLGSLTEAGSQVQGQSGQLCETLSQNKIKKGGRHSSVIEPGYDYCFKRLYYIFCGSKLQIKKQNG